MAQAQTVESNEALDARSVGILSLNQMTYKLEPDLAVTIQRNVQSSFFLSQSYAPGSTMVCIVNSGSSFVNLRQSYLVMDVQNTTSAGQDGKVAWFGSSGGSAANFINRIQIIAKNGVQLERIDNANVLAAAKVAYVYSTDWTNSVGALAGISSSAAALNWTHAAAGGAIIRFMIPLYLFSTFCDSMGSLCPSQLLAGARFEIFLENPNVAMINGSSGETGSPVLNYAVTACRIDFESYLLADSVMRVLNQTAASQGLEVVTATTQDTQAQRTSAAITVDVARSCSRALHMLYKERIPASAVAAGANVPTNVSTGQYFDKIASAPLAYNVNGTSGGTFTNIPIEWLVRAGQIYFPQQSIRGNGGQTGLADNDLYLQTLRSFQKLWSGVYGQNASSNCSLAAFRGSTAGGATITAPGSAEAVFALDLQRSAVLTSGIPLSNSRQLQIFLNTQFSQPVAFAYLVDVYLTYQVLARTFLSQVVLEV